MSRTLFTSRALGDLKEDHLRKELRNLLSLKDIRFMKQSHSDVVIFVEGIFEQSYEELNCDALVSATAGIGLAALAADCMPITFTAAGVIGVAHVGRVGLIKGIAGKVVDVMRHHGAKDIEAIIGPSICGKCYEVSPQMYQEVISILPECATSTELHALDLQAGVIAQLKTSGVKSRDLGICTQENPMYFSYRGGDLVARQAGVISL